MWATLCGCYLSVYILSFFRSGSGPVHTNDFCKYILQWYSQTYHSMLENIDHSWCLTMPLNCGFCSQICCAYTERIIGFAILPLSSIQSRIGWNFLQVCFPILPSTREKSFQWYSGDGDMSPWHMITWRIWSIQCSRCSTSQPTNDEALGWWLEIVTFEYSSFDISNLIAFKQCSEWNIAGLVRS